MFDLRSAAHALGGEVSGEQVLAPGPGHSPKDRSLSVKPDPNAPGGFLVESFAGDDWKICKDYVREKLGLGPFTPGANASGSGKRTVEANYNYTDELGEILFQVSRWRPKGFSQRRPDGKGGWIKNIDGVRRVPYRLPDVVKAVQSGQPIYIAEGEKDCDALDRLGVIATCNSGGANKWKEEHSQPFRGADVVIFPDKDSAGEDHLNQVARSLVGVAARIRVIRVEAKDPSVWIAAGGTIEQLWHLTDAAPEWSPSSPSSGSEEAPKANGSGLIFFSDIEQATQKVMLVDDFLGAEDLGCDFGKPSAGKSVIAGDRNFHLAANRAWFGRRVEQCGVLHVAAERFGVVKRRYAALRLHYGITDIPLATLGRRVNLCSSKDDARMIIDCCKQIEDLKGIRTGLVCIETVNKVMAGGDENSPKDMGAFVDNLAFIQEEARVAISLVHHIPADGTKRLRGFGGLLGACDVTNLVEKIGKLHSCTVDKANDGPEGEKIVFSLKSVELFHDPITGISTTAPVVIPHDGAMPRATRERRLTDTQQLALEALQSLIAERGVKLPPSFGLPPYLLALSIDAWRDELYSRGVLKRDASNPSAEFKRLTDQLKARHLIAEKEKLIWLVSKEPST